MADVVERLERQPAHERGVADDDRDPLEPVTQVTRLGEPFGDRQTGPGMSAIEHVVRRLRSSREPAHAIELAQRAEALQAAGEELVRVGLVAGVPDDAIAWRLEQPVQRDRQLDDPERRAKVTAGMRHGLHDRVADLDRQLRQLDFVEPTQVGGLLDGGQDRHGYELLGLSAGETAASVGLTSQPTRM